MQTDLFREQMYALEKQRSFLEDFVLPDYQMLNVKNVLPTLASLFGLDQQGPTFPKDHLADSEGAQKVVLFVFDGLGYNRLLHYMGNHNGTLLKFAESGVFKPLTTVFPSTTSTVLTSIFTGLTPAEHQILGYHMFSKKYGVVFNTLDMKPVYGYNSNVELAKEYVHAIKPTVPCFSENGVNTVAFTKAAIAGSGLSQIIHRNHHLIPYLLGSDMFAQLRKALEQRGPALFIVYYSGVDTLAHRYGAYSEEVTFELASVEHQLRHFVDVLSEETKKETLMVMCADHGVADAKQSYYLRDSMEIMGQLMLPPVGDGRATFLYSKPDGRDALAEAFKRSIGGFRLFPSGELIEAAVFGKPVDLEGLKEKVGDYSALSNSQSLLEYPFYEDDRTHAQLGAHGGMTAEEMLVPLLSVKL